MKNIKLFLDRYTNKEITEDLKKELYDELNRIFIEDNFFNKYELFKQFAKVEDRYSLGGSLKKRIKIIKKY